MFQFIHLAQGQLRKIDPNFQGVFVGAVCYWNTRPGRLENMCTALLFHDCFSFYHA